MTDVDNCIAKLKALFGAQLSTSKSVLDQHGHDESWHEVLAPDAVLFAETTADVTQCAEVCTQFRVPMIPFGTGSSMEGNVNAVLGGISLDTSRMNRILAVNTADMDCEVEAGVTCEQLNEHLRDQGLFFPVDAGAYASIGGMAATRAAGTTTVKYGSMRENVIGLEVILADGTVFNSGGRARKSSSGYDLTRLFVGSEGTLGIITKISLRLHPIPETILALTAQFPTVEAAVEMTCELMQSGLPVARAELLDELAIEAVNRYCKTDYSLSPAMFLEFHGNPTSVCEVSGSVETLCREHGATQIEHATTTEDRKRIWDARHKVAFAERTLRPGAQCFVTDVAVPVSCLPVAIRKAKSNLGEVDLIAPLSGHVGDGNFHFSLLIDRDEPREIGAAERFHECLIRTAIELGGTVSGEHGVGMGKSRFMEIEHGNGLAVMRKIKLALDPNCLLNPGKVFPSVGS